MDDRFRDRKDILLIPGKRVFESEPDSDRSPTAILSVHIVILPKKPYHNWMSVDLHQ
jgi:hypothetical protein